MSRTEMSRTLPGGGLRPLTAVGETTIRPASRAVRTASRPASRAAPASRPRVHPRAQSTFCIADASYRRWVSAHPGCEQITITEEDLWRYGHDRKKLRQCQLRPVETDALGRKEQKTLSFKSSFRQKCLSETALLNPWEKMQNPEMSRLPSEGDLFINQVWEENLRPTRLGLPRLDVPPSNGSSSARSVSTRASSTDFTGRLLPSPSGSTQRRSRRRSSSRSVLTEPDSTSRPSSGKVLHLSASEGALTLNSTVVDRIQPIDESEFQSMDPASNDPAQRPIDDEWLARRRSRPRALWISVDPSSGHVTVFPKAVATRLEAAHLDRSSVPLAGLGEASYEGSIVSFGHHVEDDGYVERRPDGPRDVRRIRVAGSAADVVVHVLPPGADSNTWRITDSPVPGRSRERAVMVSRSHLVSPPSPKQAVVRERTQCFLNFGAFEGH